MKVRSADTRVAGFAFVVPGRLDQFTGGYLFDRRVVDGARARGRCVHVIELPGTFPDADDIARAAASDALARLPDAHVVVIDGLALPAFAHCLAAHAHRLRLIGLVHHPLALETGLSPEASQRVALLEARLWRPLRGVLCPSAHTARAVAAAGIETARIVIAPPGVDRPAADHRTPQTVSDDHAVSDHHAAPDDRAVPNDHAAPKDRPAIRPPTGAHGNHPQAVPPPVRLLTIATVTPRKGHRLLVEALAPLGGLDWRLDCIGSLTRDPQTTASVRAAIDAHRLGARITLCGELPTQAVTAALRDADVFVLPSFHEGYGMVFAEALAHGLPIVATTAGAIPDTVPGDAGLLVPPGDVRALSEALRRVVEDTALRTRLAAAARQAGRSLPDWPAAVDRWLAGLDVLAGLDGHDGADGHVGADGRVGPDGLAGPDGRVRPDAGAA